MFFRRRCKCGGKVVERVGFGELEDVAINEEKISGVGTYYICLKCGKKTKLFFKDKLAKKDWKDLNAKELERKEL